MIERAATEEEMMELGRQAAAGAHPGSVWWLSGDLGAGKTHWTKGFVKGLGCDAPVTSPTFGLVHEYPGGRCPVYHFDFYRLGSVEELLALGWDEYLDQDAIVVVEWGERFADAFPQDTKRVEITTLAEGIREVRTT